MTDKDLIKKVADIPLARPGFDALGMAAPILVNVNPDGNWESTAPANIDQEQLKKIIAHLMKTNAISTAQSFCPQCCSENRTSGGENPNAYVPIIIMPIMPADQCPFDMDDGVQKTKEATKQKKKAEKSEGEAGKSQANTKQKKRVFFMQRLTDFDLLSQW